MLKITKDRTFKKTVRLELPSTSKTDGVEKVEFVAVFRALTASQIEAYKTDKPSDADFLRQIIVGVEGVGDEDGNPLPPDVALAAVLDDLALVSAAVDVFNGNNAKAKAGN